MVSENVKPPATGRPEGPRVLTKPLPQILDEMDDNIRIAVDAAQRAEEAARVARQAAESAIKASDKAGSRAEDSRRAAEQAEKIVQKAEKETVLRTEETDKDSGHKYLVIYEKANSNYSAYLPDLPGCIATGKNKGEVEKNIKKAIAFHIDGLKKDGLVIPKPSSFTEYVEV